MNKYQIIRKIEEFAPPELAEPWDCSGWLVETQQQDIKKIMFALTMTKNIFEQAKKHNCDMIVLHHPLFFIPMEWSDIDIYCAHTNMDKTSGGTTDELIKNLGFEITDTKDFVRYTETNISVEGLIKKLSKIAPHLRYTNNKSISTIKKIGFCAGSGMEFIKEAQENHADAFISGDLKFHTALDSEIMVVDIGHFESEIGILKVFSQIIGDRVEKIFAEEKSPFIQI